MCLNRDHAKESKSPEAMGRSASSNVMETKIDSDISVKEEKTLSVIPSEKDFAIQFL